VSCLNNVAQLGLAVHNYQFNFETLPPGVTDAKGPIRNEPQGLHVSWLVNILPYMEERVLSDKFDQSAGAYASANAQVRSTPIQILMCPSSPSENTNEDKTIAYTTYAGCYNDAEAPIDVNNNGLLFLNSHVRYDEIYDGSSKTLLISEKFIDPNDLGWVSGTRATLRNTSKIEQLRDRPRQQGEAANNGAAGDVTDSLFVGGFGGYHPGAVNAAFADGSTRTISDSIDPEVLKRLGNRADHEIVKAF
jgi:prepilin-type processing-associated H-X9-DG protein